MSKAFELDQTSIPEQYSFDLKDNCGMLWVGSRTGDLYRTMFSAIASLLKFYQNKETPKVGMAFKDDKGRFKLGAILTYKTPEEGSEEDSGNWYLNFTFDEADMEGLDMIVDNHSDEFNRCAATEASNIMYGRFRDVSMMNTMFNCAIDNIVKFLDKNASETEEVDLTLKGIFTASVGVENGIKVMSIVPGEYIKQIIKNDSAL